ncbi:vWA domain-containing protein [Crateriforma conspicua]|uniref:VWFA domain-containing protein n=1 Tax=Crateriforma conspicua TaxID=2527996 RepID=A0A5C6FXQ2_9PLAN|nr:VWA domain-containing protein [Crateriforma conspicua]TWU67114.1 hypothetical protein V7x_26870 [Crateriforma conspicua]
MIAAWTDFHFIRPWALLAIPLALAIGWYFHRSADPLRGWRQQMDRGLLNALTQNQHDVASWRRYQWLVIAIVASLAVAGPTWQRMANPFAKDAPPVVILLSASDSMAAIDVSPNPLDRAKIKIDDLADRRAGEPLGLIAYAGSAHVVLPPTEDTAVVANMAAEVSPDIMPVPGNRLDLAIPAAVELLKAFDGAGSLLVVADRIDADPKTVAESHQKAGRPPIQFLAMSPPGTDADRSIKDVAEALRATVQVDSVDDSDIDAVIAQANRRSAATTEGQTERWEEFGYWLTPLIMLMVALGFRRQQAAGR